ncbi:MULTISPECIES: DUF6366 family protein [Gracilibacillus]|uniref:Phage capsid protein n=1 Tax=Gracilibacillus dipsosauri TaxID=178340 RepID=A0A317KVV1_9BACI|nr:DUF6366 family protein [Gracilibacillus dipsosauri]PWU67617.1 hypothetical protein DLJ74_14245 [Gracilibacillus dipsosauri]
MSNRETAEQKRERLRQSELKNNPTTNVSDGFSRAQNGSLVDLVGSLGWKGTGILLIIMVVGFIIFLVFFR